MARYVVRASCQTRECLTVCTPIMHHSHQSILQGGPSFVDQASCLSHTGTESPSWYAEFSGPCLYYKIKFCHQTKLGN